MSPIIQLKHINFLLFKRHRIITENLNNSDIKGNLVSIDIFKIAH
jgi:hypothetical protein